jgi:hypothetical protein
VDFKQAEIKFKQLKVQFETGKLTEAEFKTQLEGLMVQDESGSWWMIGYETELWYRHDGENWIQTDVPGNLPKKPKSLVPTEHKETESKSSEKAPREKAERETAEKAAKLKEKPLRRPLRKSWSGRRPRRLLEKKLTEKSLRRLERKLQSRRTGKNLKRVNLEQNLPIGRLLVTISYSDLDYFILIKQ